MVMPALFGHQGNSFRAANLVEKIKAVLLLSLLLTGGRGGAADIWTSVDGKTISADFVRINGTDVVLKMNGKDYPVALDKLEPKFQGYAIFLQEQLGKWASQNLDMPIISEGILNEIISFNWQLAEGKQFLVEGFVESIKPSVSLGSISGSAAEIRLQGGTMLVAKFPGATDGRRTKLRINGDGVIIMKARQLTSNGPRNFTPEKTLVGKGQKIVVHAKVKGGRVEGIDIASSQDVTQALMEAAKANGGLKMEEVAQMERIRIRIEFLESSLAGDAGTAKLSGRTGYIGRLTFEYSDAEKEAMRKELELLRAQLGASAKP